MPGQDILTGIPRRLAFWDTGLEFVWIDQDYLLCLGMFFCALVDYRAAGVFGEFP